MPSTSTTTAVRGGRRPRAGVAGGLALAVVAALAVATAPAATAAPGAQAAVVVPPVDAEGYSVILDGSQESFDMWAYAGDGGFDLNDDGTVTSRVGEDGGFGTLWYPAKELGDFSLKLEWRDDAPGAADVRGNSGVQVRFPDLSQPLAGCPTTFDGNEQNNLSWIAVNCGHEIQINDSAEVEGNDPRKTGSVYGFADIGLAAGNTTPKGEWNELEIRVIDQTYTVLRDGVVINTYENLPGVPFPGRPNDPDSSSRGLTGYVGLQAHGADQDRVSFRNVRVQEISPFTDVAGSIFSAQISWLVNSGITTGWENPDGTLEYRPLAPIARDAMAAFLFRLADEPGYQAPDVSPFVDVATDDLYYREIAWLAENDISTGWVDPVTGDAEFRPLAPIGRDAMAAFLYRMADEPAFEAFPVSPFTDLTPSTPFYTEISWLVSEGIAFGWLGNDGSAIYRPVEPINRDAMAAFLFRYDKAGFTAAD
ncbi:3-keto-disaccharide hydrolase [Serinibacter arcticus]|uniref:SLH domain-containing protein n=1 Tax=Serinibacter arcticus TaxID=1655435 RepID=A0A4Z1E8A4_9MICO|nr:DUF1080 domain-containing protein [Serinibacter arcticus]TGO05731.1 hypothetical protein SERN_1735 [Serinibacter arcticus]